MKLTKCEQCGGPTAEGLPLCPDCMRATGAAADQIAAAEELRFGTREAHLKRGNGQILQSLSPDFLLDYLGIEKERTRVEWVSAAEGAKFAATMNDFVETITKLGENRRLEDLRCKE